MISDMAIEIDGVEYLFMADALVFAGDPYFRWVLSPDSRFAIMSMRV